MTNTMFKLISFLVAIGLVLGVGAGTALAQVYIHANGGAYWTQWGSGWSSINNQGYCVSGRGPCGSSLWYMQTSNNTSGCGYTENSRYTMASVVNFNGDTYAWVDNSTGNMYGADYSVSYNSGSSYAANIDQSGSFEGWRTIALDLYRTATVWHSDGWSATYACNSVGGLTVEFDEVKLEI